MVGPVGLVPNSISARPSLRDVPSPLRYVKPTSWALTLVRFAQRAPLRGGGPGGVGA
jgi:hypothetical protein